MNKGSLVWGVILGMTVLQIGVAETVFPIATAHANPSTPLSVSEFQSKLEKLASRARPGTFGIAVLDLKSGQSWSVNGDRAFPMMSVFKAPLGATVLAQVETHQISLEQTITITRADLRLGASKIAHELRGDRMTFTVGELLAGAVSHSDNTAADALVKLVGGPQAITSYLQAHGITGMHVDLDEGGVEHVFSGLRSATSPPASETAEERSKRLWRGYQAFLEDPRNRSTPKAAADFLRKLCHRSPSELAKR